MTRPAQEHIRDVILNSVADGVFTVDGNWRITSFNRAAERITGVPKADAIGQHCCDVFRASICEGQCALRETLKTGHQIVNKAIYVLDANGRRLPVSISTAILKDDEGKVIGGVETFRDLSEVEELRKELTEKYTFEDIVGRSAALQELFGLLPQIADSDSTVLIEGPSGTGKELFARAIHHLSGRRDGPFITINCGALPDTLLESELFGHKAGAFTDARQDRTGRFAAANGGTILLDEVGDVSPAMQSRLLRVLQERIVEPLGSVEQVKVDVRVIAATNRDLAELVQTGDFREDLYYRINIVRLELPALRDRREDIPLLIEHFITKYNRLRSRSVDGISDEAMARLMAHDYPGNIRELENIIEHAFVLCRGELLEVQHLPLPLRPDDVSPTAPRAGGTTLRELEAMHIADAIRHHAGNRAAAAEELGIHQSTLFRKIKSLGIDLPSQDGRSHRSR